MIHQAGKMYGGCFIRLTAWSLTDQCELESFVKCSIYTIIFLVIIEHNMPPLELLF